MEALAITDEHDGLLGVDDSLPDGMGVLRDYVKTGLIGREKVETSGGVVTFEATYEALNDHPGTARLRTVRITEAAYQALGELGVP